jgi:esterase
MGHSMGGKVAMQIAMNYADRVDKLIIGDIAPVPYPPNHQNVFDGLNAVNVNEIKSRGDAEVILKDYIEDAGVRIFLLTNLVRNEDKSFRWRINIPALESNYDDIACAPKGPPFTGEALFIRGELSAYVPDAFKKFIKRDFPNYTLKTLEGTGHWLHAEKPVEYSKFVTDFLAT